MKKLITFIIISVFSFSACNDFLEEDLSTVITSESGALNNVQGLTAALAGTYKPLSQTWWRGLGNASTQAILMGSDVAVYRSYGVVPINQSRAQITSSLIMKMPLEIRTKSTRLPEKHFTSEHITISG
jgi:hypothetical protein